MSPFAQCAEKAPVHWGERAFESLHVGRRPWTCTVLLLVRPVEHRGEVLKPAEPVRDTQGCWD